MMINLFCLLIQGGCQNKGDRGSDSRAEDYEETYNLIYLW